MEAKTEKAFSFLIVAGGSGNRIGGQGKQFRLLGSSEKPLWRWSVDLALSAQSAGIEEIVLVLPQMCTGEELKEVEKSVKNLCASIPVKIASGGKTRTDSVRNGLAASSCDYVMVHDAARPFVSIDLLHRLMEETTPSVGAIPVLPVSEAVKRIEDLKVQAVDRDGLYTTQTPQSFHRETLFRVLNRKDVPEFSFKDEAEAWLAAGLELRCVEGERLNFKVTWPEDLELASALAAQRIEKEYGKKRERRRGEVRTGFGYDVHRLVPERPLVLGGVVVDSPLGLLGHSDADLLAHAVADALLGAAGLPDIGNLFPASDERYKNANSMELLKCVVEKVRQERWRISWVDGVIVAQVPRLNAFLPIMRDNLSALLAPEGTPCVNLKVKSAENTDDAGLGRSMTCYVVATLSRDDA